MIYLKNEEEKLFWKEAAKNALATVETSETEDKDAKRILSFVTLIADNLIIKYRKRLEEENSEE